MKKFKQGDYIIHTTYKSLFYISKYLDLEGDFIFLTNDRELGNDLKKFDYEKNYFISEEIYDNLLMEAEKLNFKYAVFAPPTHSIYSKYKFATRQKLINILNR